jgi:hypothetical protein
LSGAHRRAGVFRRGGGTFGSCLLLTVTVSIAGAAAMSDDDSEPALVVTQRTVATATRQRVGVAGGMLDAGCGDGARIALVRNGRIERVLTAGYDSACDPDVSFDGRRMLFAGKRRSTDPWNVFEMELDRSGTRQITDDPHDCRHPTYQGTFYTIDSTEPWPKITFVSTRAGEQNEYGSFLSTSLYSVNLDGSSLHRITFNPSSDTDPTVLPDGRLLFSSWQRRSLTRGPLGRVSLFASQTDGLDYAVFASDEGRRVKRMPCVTSDRLVVFVENDEVTDDGSGTLASVSLRRNLHSYRRITTEEQGRFHSPSAMPNGKVLVSRRTDGESSYGVYRLDPRSGRFQPLFDDPDHDDIQAKIVAPRSRPDGRSSVASDKTTTGVLYALNVYESDLAREGWIDPGTPLRLRVLEGLPHERAGAGKASPTGEPRRLLARRLLGEIPVEEDGSFNIRIPANLPIELQLVDGDGMALRSCGWIWVRNRETRGCIGCHEDGERTPENRFVKALERESIPLTLSEEKRRTVDFRRDVIPIVSEKCASCHGAGSRTPLLDRGLEDLVHPGSARTSPLIWQIFGRVTSRPWDEKSTREALAPGHPACAGVLTDDERRTLVEWVDLGAPLDARPDGIEESDASRPDSGGDK